MRAEEEVKMESMSEWWQRRFEGAEGLFSVWLRPDGRRMASVSPGPCAA